MHDFGLNSEPENFPGAASAESARTGIERWREGAGNADDPALARFAAAFPAKAAERRLLEAVFGNSPFLAQCAASDPAALRDIVTLGPATVVDAIMKNLEAARTTEHDDTALGRLLRIAKRRLALAVAMADIAEVWTLEKVTGAISDFAETALSVAAAHLLRQSARTGAFSLPHADDPELDSGLVILGMGKLGSRELNYSSDIDFIVLYDPDTFETADASALHNHVVRLTRNLIRLMEERTTDGYVFRTDLRLRPDPGSTPIALSVVAAETYYESLGQNWERAAMIKARPVAGDRAAGRAFLKWLGPFIWRKSLDFAAIQDIHSIKRQINARRGGGRVAIAGHNIKLGRGGIREIEFFVQTQQLIWGGREPRLRCAATVESLLALARCGQIDRPTADDLIAAYRALRRIEHRLQMIDDEQTHSLPDSAEGLNDLAVFLGYDDGDAMAGALMATLRTVESHYADLFEDAPALSAPSAAAGNLVFTGGEPDPETLGTIEGLGYGIPQGIDRAIRGWHHGRYRAMRSTRAREILTELVPALLEALARMSNPDDAFMRFDSFLARLPAGVQLFAMFHSNPHLLDLVAEIIGGAPRLAEHLSRRPFILDNVLTADFFEPPPPMETLDEELERLLALAASIEDVLDVCRRWAHDRKFQIGVQSLRESIEPGAAGIALSNIAEVALNRLLPHVEGAFADRHGRIAGSELVIIAMGKLGGREMTQTSDLDLIFVYTVPEGTEASDGARPLSPGHYFARLSQRLIAAVTAQTNEGSLYDVDMRLRPSGHAGPIASSREAWVRYHDESSWTWEHMALTRARVVAGADKLRRDMEDLIEGVLTRHRDSDDLVVAVADMRERMASEHQTDILWDVKHLRGGLVDVEFIAQYLQLRHGHDHPGILATNTRTALKLCRDAALLDAAAAGQLIEALDLWQAIQGKLRLAVAGQIGKDWEDQVPRALQADLAKAGGAVDFAALKEKMRSIAATTHAHLQTLIATPAAARKKDIKS
ncbi:MAG: bifunctional [glutamine synthetase] adenylyltransferase/[glutamine synthetase]-adenylyl-L-tyrosine phosphorylase [Rhodospirillales bacterium]|jgi:glutamate-ammonia-ligase adenylyltransferase|nr:bifunctional [glutamine synthetase] adenylyltransferase/[glutamine synthetase]-adenylyl-L-tyrosine phosphorylase [Rhodospirillales bacterium]